jgi:hypothetical protein
MGELRNAYCVSVGKQGRDRLEDVGVDCKIILEWILGKYDGRLWIGFIWLRIGTVVGLCEHGGDPSVSVEGA